MPRICHPILKRPGGPLNEGSLNILIKIPISPCSPALLHWFNLHSTGFIHNMQSCGSAWPNGLGNILWRGKHLFELSSKISLNQEINLNTQKMALDPVSARESIYYQSDSLQQS